MVTPIHNVAASCHSVVGMGSCSGTCSRKAPAKLPPPPKHVIDFSPDSDGSSLQLEISISSVNSFRHADCVQVWRDLLTPFAFRCWMLIFVFFVLGMGSCSRYWASSSFSFSRLDYRCVGRQASECKFFYCLIVQDSRNKSLLFSCEKHRGGQRRKKVALEKKIAPFGVSWFSNVFRTSLLEDIFFCGP
jgi:hypothetical protein